MQLKDLFGTWLFVRSEIPAPYEAGKDIWHFTSDGIHIQERLLGRADSKEWNFRYSLAGNGLTIRSETDNLCSHLPVCLDGEFLTVTGIHGYRSWLRRLSDEDLRESFQALKRFINSSGEEQRDDDRGD